MTRAVSEHRPEPGPSADERVTRAGMRTVRALRARGARPRALHRVAWVAVALLLAFWAGRATSPAETTGGAAPGVDVSEAAAEVDAEPRLCPCPEPPPPPSAASRIKRKRLPPADTALPTEDRTEETARFLRARAGELASCAPRTGGRTRVHLEIRIAPAGEIEDVRITNLDPVPQAIARCLDTELRAVRPPAFDGASSETFAITVVL